MRPTPVVPGEDQDRRPLCTQHDGRNCLHGRELVQFEANAIILNEREWRPNVRYASERRYVDDGDRPLD
jgi:hypothetical protein